MKSGNVRFPSVFFFFFFCNCFHQIQWLVKAHGWGSWVKWTNANHIYIYIYLHACTHKQIRSAHLQLTLLFSCPVMSNSLIPHVLQHTRLPCPSLCPRVCSKSCPSSQWCIQPSHPLSPPSPPAFNLSQHHGLFERVGSSLQVTKVLELQLQSFQWIFRVDFL